MSAYPRAVAEGWLPIAALRELKSRPLQGAERLLRLEQMELENRHLRSLLDARERQPVAGIAAGWLCAIHAGRSGHACRSGSIPGDAWRRNGDDDASRPRRATSQATP